MLEIIILDALVTATYVIPVVLVVGIALAVVEFIRGLNQDNRSS